MKSFLFLLALTAIPACLFSQVKSGKITGVVYQKTSNTTKKPLADANVGIPGIGYQTTTSNGVFSIPCTACPPGTALKIYVNSDTGSAEKEIAMPNNQNYTPIEIIVTANNKLILSGFVKDKKTGSLIPGVKVTAVIPNFDGPAPTGVSDGQGIFNIIIRKDGAPDMQAVKLVFSDQDHNKYKDAKETVFINQLQPIEIEMEECVDCGSKTSLKIRGNTPTGIKIDRGDLVIIKASGTMTVGPAVGTSGPEGLRNGVLGLSLARYNLDEFRDLNHAALLYRFGKDDAWKVYEKDKEMKYQSDVNGYLEFKINDKFPSDNSGAYAVEIIVRK